MTPTEVTTILRQFNTRCTGEIEMIDINELRRLAQAATPGPWKMLPVGDGRQKFAVADSEFLSILTVTDEGGATFGTVYDDDDARFIAAANPAAISELLDRLEAAEKAVAEAYQRGYATGQEEIEKERDALRTGLADLRSSMTFRTSLIGRIEAERDALRAKIEQMERQGPVGQFIQHPSNGLWEQDGYGDNPDARPLYALPGVKGE